jgi:hypothetical protein
MIINLRQNKNDESTAFGKYFAEADTKEPLNLKGFAKHMTAHGKIADYQIGTDRRRDGCGKGLRRAHQRHQDQLQPRELQR